MIFFSNTKPTLPVPANNAQRDAIPAYVWAGRHITLMRGCSDTMNYQGRVYRVENSQLFPDFYDRFSALDGVRGAEMTAMCQFLNVIRTRLAGFNDTLRQTVMWVIPDATPAQANEMLRNPLGVSPLVWGIATARWLIANRSSRLLMNDVTFQMLASREMGSATDHDYWWTVSGAYGADRAIVNGASVDGVAVSFGARQPGWWHTTCKHSSLPVTASASFDNSASINIGTLTKEALYDAYPILGLLPWWAQALIFAHDIVIRANKINRYRYLANPSASVPNDPTFKECYYPYVLMEQPGLNGLRVRSHIRAWGVLRSVTFMLKKVGFERTHEDMLLQGVGSEQSTLFNNIKEAKLATVNWAALIAGLENKHASILTVNDIASTVLRQYLATNPTFFGYAYNSDISIDTQVPLLDKLREWVYSGVVPSGMDTVNPPTAARHGAALQRFIKLK